MSRRKRLAVANWKQNPGTHTDALELFTGIKREANKYKRVQTVVCPPFVFIDELSRKISGNNIFVGAQDIFYEDKGAHTGEVGGEQIYSVGADYTIVGHSERRALGETDEEVNKKIKTAIKYKLTPIVCIGESKRDTHGQYLTFLRHQIVAALKNIKTKDVENVVLAYEPIWAIGKMGKDAITPQKLHETVLYIRRVLRETYNGPLAEKITILYGGSVKPENSVELLQEGEVDGFLVGGASLNAEKFGEIIEAAAQ